MAPRSPHPPLRLRGPLVVVLAVLAVCAMPGTAAAGGRLIETGHDADWRCITQGAECHFLQTAVTYVRNGAPNPSLPVLVLDTADEQMSRSLDFLLGAGSVVTVNPKTEFAGVPLSTSLFSAIVVASDMTCGPQPTLPPDHGADGDPHAYCDLNRPSSFDPAAQPPQDGVPPVDMTDPAQSDSAAINLRRDDIRAFFDAGGGLYVGSGADNGDGHGGDLYYGFIDISGCPPGTVPSCSGNSNGGNLTAEGQAIGFTAGDTLCGDRCSTLNSFLSPRAGSPLHIAEGGPPAPVDTLFEDTQAPNTLITSGPGTPIPTATAVPIPVISSTSASIGFRPSEDTTTFTCQLDGGPSGPCSSPATVSGLSEGVHRLLIVATDAAHNSDPTPADISWLVASDRDHDGYLDINPFGAADCNENNPAINPGAKEVLGNRVDENCDGVIAPFQRISSSVPFGWERCGGNCVRITRLSALDVPIGARVRVSCRGRGCHFRHVVKRRHRTDTRVNLKRFFRNRHLRRGTVIGVAITQPGLIGRVKRLEVVKPRRRGIRIEDATLCVAVGTHRAVKSCPSIK
jgi:Putative metal-binding motif